MENLIQHFRSSQKLNSKEYANPYTAWGIPAALFSKSREAGRYMKSRSDFIKL